MWKNMQSLSAYYVDTKFYFQFPTAIELTKEINSSCGPLLKEFKAKVDEDPVIRSKIKDLKQRVENFAVSFPMPGFNDWWFAYLHMTLFTNVHKISHHNMDSFKHKAQKKSEHSFVPLVFWLTVPQHLILFSGKWKCVLCPVEHFSRDHLIQIYFHGLKRNSCVLWIFCHAVLVDIKSKLIIWTWLPYLQISTGFSIILNLEMFEERGIKMHSAFPEFYMRFELWNLLAYIICFFISWQKKILWTCAWY